MEKVILKGTDLNVTKICLGTGSYGSSFDITKCPDQLDYFYSKGGNFLDTAVAYTDWKPGERSRSEKVIGKWMKERGNRNEIILSAKGCHQDYLEPTGSAGTSKMGPLRVNRKAIKEDVEKSLELLQTDYIDIFGLHQDDPDVDVAEIIETLEEVKKSGKIRYYGCSNWTVERQRLAYEYAKSKGYEGFIMDQLNWSINKINADGLVAEGNVAMNDELYDFHNQTQINVLAYSSSGRGYMQKRASNLPMRDTDHEKYDNPQNELILPVLIDIANKHKVAVHSVVIKFMTVERNFTAIPIASCRSNEGLDVILDALNFDFDKEDMTALKAVAQYI